jgi:hypothetical protein
MMNSGGVPESRVELHGDPIVWGHGDSIVWSVLPLIHQDALSLFLRVRVTEHGLRCKTIAAPRNHAHEFAAPGTWAWWCLQQAPFQRKHHSVDKKFPSVDSVVGWDADDASR